MTNQTTFTVTEYAAHLGVDRKSARQRLDRMVRWGTATREVVTQRIETTRWGKPCKVRTTFAIYTLKPGAE